MVTSSSAKSRSQVRSDWTASASSGRTSIRGTVTVCPVCLAFRDAEGRWLFLGTIIDAEVIGTHDTDSFSAGDFLVAIGDVEAPPSHSFAH